MDDKEKKADQLAEALERANAALAEAKAKLERQEWGINKTNDAIRFLYKELEEKNRRLKDLDRMKSDFISTVSHELRTPLSNIKDGVGIVLDKITGNINENQKRTLDSARNNIDRLERTINNLLDASKIEAGKMELNRKELDLADLIRQAILPFGAKAQMKGVSLETDLPKKKINAYIDRDKMIQVFTNLIANAIKFTEKGYIKISGSEKKEGIECSVADTGIGIPKEDLSRVFDKFQQFGRGPETQDKGTGLGLSIVKSIIEMHRGRIWFESEQGRGTKFIFSIPKYNARMVVKDCLEAGMKEAMRDNRDFSMIVISVGGLNKIKKDLSSKKGRSFLADMEGILKYNMCRPNDAILKDTDANEINILLPDCDKRNALNVVKRLSEVLRDYLARQGLSGKVRLKFGSATYSDDAQSDEELVKKARELL